MFSNAKQSIPDRFLEKMNVDGQLSSIDFQIQSIIESYGSVIDFNEINTLKIELEPLREQRRQLLEKQDFLRKSCEAFIVERKARGPEGTA